MANWAKIISRFGGEGGMETVAHIGRIGGRRATYAGENVGKIAGLTSHIEGLFKKFPEAASNLRSLKFSDNADRMMSGIANYSAGTRNINLNIAKISSANLGSGWSYARSGSLEDAFTHEFGHHVDFTLRSDVIPGGKVHAGLYDAMQGDLGEGKRTARKFTQDQRAMRSSSSTYGHTNKEEFFAEEFLRSQTQFGNPAISEQVQGALRGVKPKVAGIDPGIIDQNTGFHRSSEYYRSPRKGRRRVTVNRDMKTSSTLLAGHRGSPELRSSALAATLHL
jgi:hypothetical protein